eukprot:TRINITY_DN4685_c1_g1_i4.p1 TRINITY_DN4685_c1_g1~~TRINITY_DN4685_c1_g1_i4.p1  ORF type:complete len:333 (-),score=61.36 TRINITY_DN4685_c1_g1_i4:82-1080(-)
MGNPSIGIIGAGVIGLGSAAHVLKHHPNANVRIIADKFKNQTTSWGSGGFWEPYVMADTPPHKIHEWGKLTFDNFLDINNSDAQQQSGVQRQQVRQYWTDGVSREAPFWSDIVFDFRMMEADELRSGLGRATSGWTFGSIVADQSYYMPWLMERLEAQGCKFQQGKLEKIDDLKEEGFDVIVNCAGIGTRQLVPDEEVYPVRGQVIRVKAPQVQGVWFIDETTYIITNTDTVVVGGTQQINDWNEENDQDNIDAILRKVCEVVPQLEGVEVVQAWAGLRPARKQVRLEKEIVQMGNGWDIKIVHNYGHGGSGVTLHWGCGFEAANLVDSLLQ